ncbi:MAG: hypothetical protein LUD47_07755 [Clostridia bacterium]|nr:hypothetical protein [Clostridia bacterium]
MSGTANDARHDMINRILRLDADDDDERNERGIHSHGNTRLPYGLCKEYGIDTTGFTPKDCWKALKGEDVSPKEAYQYLNEHGTIEGYKPKGSKTVKKDPIDSLNLNDQERESFKGRRKATREWFEAIRDNEKNGKEWLTGNPPNYPSESYEIYRKHENDDGVSDVYRAICDNYRAVAAVMEVERETRNIKSALAHGFTEVGNHKSYMKDYIGRTKEAMETCEDDEVKAWCEEMLDKIVMPQEEIDKQLEENKEKKRKAQEEAEQRRKEQEKKKQEARAELKKNPNWGKRGVRKVSECKTPAEAAKWAKDNLGIDMYNDAHGKSAGKDAYATKQFTAEQCNQINNALMSIYESYGVKPAKIGASNRFKTGKLAWWQVGRHEMDFLNTNRLPAIKTYRKTYDKMISKAEETIAEMELSLKTAKTDGNKEAITQIENDIAAKKQDKANLEKAREAYTDPSRRHNVFIEGREMESLVVHELGHMLRDAVDDVLKSKQTLEATKLKSGDVIFTSGKFVEKKLWDLVSKHGDKGKISVYAYEDGKPCEMFAECFTMYYMGEQLPDYIEEYMDAVTKIIMDD